MKKLIQAILMAVFMMLLVIPQAVQAQEYSSEQDYYQAVQDNQRVYDFAELLSDSERENIEEKISDASEQSGLDIVVLTVNQMFGKTDREMADDFTITDSSDLNWKEKKIPESFSSSTWKTDSYTFPRQERESIM